MNRIAVYLHIYTPILQEEEFKILMPGSLIRGNRTDIEKETLEYQENAGERQKKDKSCICCYLKLVEAAEISIDKNIAHANFI